MNKRMELRIYIEDKINFCDIDHVIFRLEIKKNKHTIAITPNKEMQPQTKNPETAAIAYINIMFTEFLLTLKLNKCKKTNIPNKQIKTMHNLYLIGLPVKF